MLEKRSRTPNVSLRPTHTRCPWVNSSTCTETGNYNQSRFPASLSMGDWSEVQTHQVTVARHPNSLNFCVRKGGCKVGAIDGLQRVSTLLEFMGALRNPETNQNERPIALVETRYLKSLDKVVWEKSPTISDIPLTDQVALPAPLQLAIRRSRVSVEILKRPSSNETKYELFQRLNAGGTQANAQELRNVIVIMVSPAYHQFMRECADRQSYLTVLSAAPISSKSSVTWNMCLASWCTPMHSTTASSTWKSSSTRALSTSL